jgi:ribosomal protein L3
MAGRMGGETVTVKGLTVMAVDRKANMLTISGLVPGAVNGIVVINRLSDRKEVVKEEKPEELQEVKQEAVEKKA